MISSRVNLKRRVTDDMPEQPLLVSQYLLVSDEASSCFFAGSRPSHDYSLPKNDVFPNFLFYSGAATPVLTNPIEVVKVRMSTAPPNSLPAYRRFWTALPLSTISLLTD